MAICVGTSEFKVPGPMHSSGTGAGYNSSLVVWGGIGDVSWLKAPLKLC